MVLYRDHQIDHEGFTNRKAYTVGVVSRTAATVCGNASFWMKYPFLNHERAGTFIPDTHTMVSSYIDWIVKTIGGVDVDSGRISKSRCWFGVCS